MKLFGSYWYCMVVFVALKVVEIQAFQSTRPLSILSPSSSSSVGSLYSIGATTTDDLWEDYDKEFQLSSEKNNLPPLSIDSVLDPEPPSFSSTAPTLFRERHGWCPYSERVWLTLELAGIDYDTVRIDNTGGPRPSYYGGGQTPQLKWPEGRTQGESMDLVNALDERYCDGKLQSDSAEVQALVKKFSSIFPRARPSSRAAFLFQMNGDPLSKSTFERTLQETDALLATTKTKGPFLAGSDQITVADIAWAPFLERYRYQLPCLHEGLDPANAGTYPNLAQWYQAMDALPEYACRVKGDAASWRKVLTMAGFGNAGVPTAIQGTMDALQTKEQEEAMVSQDDLETWTAYSSTRPYVQSSPYREAAAIITRNREAILRDLLTQATKPAWKSFGLPTEPEEAEQALVSLVDALLLPTDQGTSGGSSNKRPPLDFMGAVAAFLDERMCVPRDMGAMAAGTIKVLAKTQKS